MELVGALRELYGRRLLVGVGIVVALTIGCLVAFRVSLGVPPKLESRQYAVAVATAAVLIDSPDSQVVDLGRQGSGADVAVLAARARLLARLMATTGLKDRIAERARVTPLQLVGIPPASDDGAPIAAAPASSLRSDVSEQLTMTLFVDESLPIIVVETRAPTPAVAARVSTAAVAELETYLEQEATTAGVPDARQLVARPLGVATTATVQKGTSPRLGLLAFGVMVFLWCVGILAASGFRRGWRQAVASERGDGDGGREGGDDHNEAALPPSAVDAERLPQGRDWAGLLAGDADPAAVAEEATAESQAASHGRRRLRLPTA